MTLARTTTLTLLSSAFAIGGCAPAVIVGGASVLDSATQEKGLGGTIKDTEIRAKINFLWFKHSSEMYQGLSLSVQEGKVMITGSVKNPVHKTEAEGIAWTVKGVQEVINNIELEEDLQYDSSYINDLRIQKEVGAKLLLEDGIRSRNYNVSVHNRTVYILGVAQSQEEMSRALEFARRVGGVRKVVSYLRLKSEPVTSSNPKKIVAAPSSNDRG